MSSTLSVYFYIVTLFYLDAVELFFYEGLFVYSFKHKSRFSARIVSYVALSSLIVIGTGIGLAYGCTTGLESTPYATEIMRIPSNVIVFALGLGFTIFCFEEKPVVTIFAAVAANAEKLLTTSLTGMIAHFGITHPLSIFLGEATLFSFVWYFAIHAIIMSATYLFFARDFARMQKNISGVMTKSVVIVFILFTFVLIGMSGSNVFIYTEDKEGSLVFNITLVIFAMLVLFVQRFSLYWIKDAQEIEAQRRFHENFVAQNEIRRKDMEMINIKCHDLKHQMRALLTGKDLDESFVNEVENLIRIYDSGIHTGNEALDVLLSEKSLTCAVNHIKFSVMIEGAALSFLSVAEINSFFGNAIDNAIEYLLTVPEDLREIRILSRRNGSLYMIRVENYCEKKVRFDKQGLPVTTKEDDRYHGFGTRSIKAVAESHEGTIRFSREDDLFVLSVLFSL